MCAGPGRSSIHSLFSTLICTFVRNLLTLAASYPSISMFSVPRNSGSSFPLYSISTCPIAPRRNISLVGTILMHEQLDVISSIWQLSSDGPSCKYSFPLAAPPGATLPNLSSAGSTLTGAASLGRAINPGCPVPIDALPRRATAATTPPPSHTTGFTFFTHTPHLQSIIP